VTHRHIIIIAPDFYPNVGGYAHVVTNFVTWLKNRDNMRITVITPTPLETSPEMEDGNISVIRVPHHKGRLWTISRTLNGLMSELRLGYAIRRTLRENPGAYLWMETFETPIAKSLALFRQNKDVLRRSFVRLHGCQETEMFSFAKGLRYRALLLFERYVARRVPNIASTTEFYLRFFRRRILNYNEILAFKNYAVLPNIIHAPPRLDGAGRDDGSIQLLALGRMNAHGYLQKNFELIAQAFYILKSENPQIYQRLNLTLVGAGDHLAAFRAVIKGLAVDDRIETVESLPNDQVRRLQADATACILVSRFEGQSAFAMESLAIGTPLIVARNTGVTEMIEDGVNGLLVDADDPTSLAGALAQLCTADHKALSSNALRLYQDHYGVENYATAFDRFLTFSEHSRKGG
jgi:glycosyltransferase involved in cell wall biosynthesis